jgi:hypothetical protein
MANTIKLKRGTSTPTTSDLSNGEVGIDTSAKKLFVNDSGTVKEIGGTTAPNFKYLELRNSSNNGSASYPGNDFTLVLAGTTTAQTVGAANQLLVSVSGVIQQPNSGTSTSGITGFIVDGNRLKTATNLPAAPDFIIFQEAGGIGAPSDGTVSTDKIIDDAVTAAKLANSINAEIAANTAKVTNATHTGEVTGATALTIADNVVDEANLKVSNSPTNGYFLSAQSGNAGGLTWAEVTTDLVGDTSPQLGGDLQSNGNDINFADNDKAVFGSGSDLQISHDSNNSLIADVGTGALVLKSNQIDFIDSTSTEFLARFFENSSVELYFDSTRRFQTTSIGVTVTGAITATDNIYLGDNKSLRIGAGHDFILTHDGTNNIINSGNGDLVLQTANNSRAFLTSTSFNPAANNTYDLGTTSLRWRNIYTNDLNLSNEGGANDIDGTWGSYTIQEGLDSLFLINKRNGKKYKFNLTEVS